MERKKHLEEKSGKRRYNLLSSRHGLYPKTSTNETTEQDYLKGGFTRLLDDCDDRIPDHNSKEKSFSMLQSTNPKTKRNSFDKHTKDRTLYFDSAQPHDRTPSMSSRFGSNYNYDVKFTVPDQQLKPPAPNTLSTSNIRVQSKHRPIPTDYDESPRSSSLSSKKTSPSISPYGSFAAVSLTDETTTEKNFLRQKSLSVLNLRRRREKKDDSNNSNSESSTLKEKNKPHRHSMVDNSKYLSMVPPIHVLSDGIRHDYEQHGKLQNDNVQSKRSETVLRPNVNRSTFDSRAFANNRSLNIKTEQQNMFSPRSDIQDNPFQDSLNKINCVSLESSRIQESRYSSGEYLQHTCPMALTKAELLNKSTDDENTLERFYKSRSSDQLVSCKCKASRSNSESSMSVNVYNLSQVSKVSIGSRDHYFQGQNGEERQVHDQLSIIVDVTKLLIQQHKNEKVFLKTKAFHAAKDKLITRHIVVISGNPGDGKSSLGMELLDFFSRDGEYHEGRTPLKISSCSEWHLVVSTNKYAVVFIDDIFGSTHYEKERQDEWEKSFNVITAAATECTTMIIISIKTQILNDHRRELEHFHLFQKDFIVDLGNKKLILTVQEKISILHNHLTRMNRTIQTSKSRIDYAKIGELEYPFGFPRCCYLFAKNDHYYIQGEAYFKNPLECVCRELDLFKNHNHDKTKYWMLVSVLFFNGLDEAVFKNASKSKEVHKLHGLAQNCECEYSLKKGRNALESMESSFVAFNTNTNKYEFTSDIIREAVCVVYGRSYPEQVLDLCSVETLNQYVKLTDCAHTCVCLHVKQSVHPRLIKRFVREISIGNIEEISKHSAWQDHYFCNSFLEVITRGKIRKLFDSYEARHNAGFLYWMLYHQSTNMRFFESLLSQFNNAAKKHSLFSSRKLRQFIEDEKYRCWRLACKSGNKVAFEILVKYGTRIDSNIVEICEHEHQFGIMSTHL